MTKFKEEWSFGPAERKRLDVKPEPLTEETIQRSIDITVKRGVDKKYDEELGLTGRSIEQIICRMGAALQKKDEKIKQLEQETEDVNECFCYKCDYCEETWGENITLDDLKINETVILRKDIEDNHGHSAWQRGTYCTVVSPTLRGNLLIIPKGEPSYCRFEVSLTEVGRLI